MKLYYRGVAYEYNPTVVETTEAGVGGKYRGLEWRFRNRSRAPIQKPTLDLVYRGIHYKTNNQGNLGNGSNDGGSNNVVKTPLKAPAQAEKVSIAEKARALFLNKERAIINRHQVMLSRSTSQAGKVSETPSSSIADKARVLLINKEREFNNRCQSMLTRLEEKVGLSPEWV